VSDATFDFEAHAREFVENFEDKEKMEVQIIDSSGNVLVSSTGFAVTAGTMPDYETALKSDASAVWNGKNSSGENIMAMTVLLKSGDNTYLGSLRYVVSLTVVDRQILILISLMLLFGVAIIFFVMLSSSYFVSTIINPITEIGRAARRIALGEYDYRIEKIYDDEIGELSDTINYMAGEISNAERVKNDFISSVSHELRTPLTAIKGWSETLRQGGASDTELTEKGLAVIAGEAERLSGIVEELLDFSRMQGGHMAMKYGRMDVLAELEEAVFLFRDRAKRDGIDLIYVEAFDLPPIIGDRDRLKQVFINIIDNAIKYSNQGDKVRIEAADMGGHVQVVVSDSGVGISKADLPNIKNKFYKANKTRPGSGIGLALADEILRRHKGRLDIDSEEGVGTTVTIMLPVAPPDVRM
jgi:signal transduction histidine kinase